MDTPVIDAMWESEQRYRSLFERNPDAVFALDASGRITLANPACTTISGYSVEELIGKRFVELCAPDQQDATIRKFQRTMAGEPPENLNTALIRKDGRRVNLLVTGGPVVEDGKVVAIHCAAKDITEAQRAEVALRISEAQNRAFFELAAVGLAEADLATSRLLRVNQKLCAITGYAQAELLQMGYQDLTHPDDREVDRQLAAEMLAGQRTSYQREKRHIRKDGTVIWVESNAVVVRDEQESPLRIAAIVVDITERKRAEEALRQSEQRLTEVTQNVHAVLWEATVTGLPGWDDPAVNEPYERPLFQWESGTTNEESFRRLLDLPEIPGQTWKAILYASRRHDMPRLDRNSRLALQRGLSGYQHEFTCRDQHGRVKHLQEAVSISPQAPGRWRLYGVITDITALKQAEGVLRASEAQQRAFFDLATVGLAEADPTTGRFLRVNEKLGAITGYLQDELLQMTVNDIIHPEDRDADRQKLAAMLADPAVACCNTERYIRKDGTIIWVEVNATAVRDDQGRAIRTIAVITDITERKAVSESLHHSEERLKQAVGVANLGIFAHDHDTDVIYFSRILRDIYGFAPNESVTLPMILGRTAPEDRVATTAHIQRAHDPASDGSYIMEHRIVHPDGSIHWVLVHSRTVFAGHGSDRHPVRTIGATMDITQRKAVEQLLQRREQEFRTLVENAPDIIERFDRQFRLVYVNPILAKIIGIPTTAFIGKTKRELGMPLALCELWEAKLTEVFANRRETGFEFDYLAPHGLMHLYARLVPEMAPNGSVETALSIVRDITAQKQAEVALRAANARAQTASQAKDQFIAVLSHELRTPLTPVLPMVQMMEADSRLSIEDREALGMIHRNVELEVRLIDDLLDLTRLSRGKMGLHMVPVDLHDLQQRVIQMCESEIHSKELKLNLKCKAKQHHVQGDAARLQQILWNLLKNAVKFTPVGGSITVRTENPAKDRLAVTVTDTGVGIKDILLPHIFNAFEQGEYARQFGGLGLGLAISKQIAELHGGTLTAHSRGKDQGATFTLELGTCAEETKAASEPNLFEVHAPKQGGRILLVEDHSDTARTMDRLLKSFGYEVRVADSVASALQYAAAETFDLVVSDIGLPDGSGHDLMRRLQTRQPLKGIVLSGYGMEEDIRKSKEAGFSAHLTKPVDLAVLKKALSEICG